LNSENLFAKAIATAIGVLLLIIFFCWMWEDVPAKDICVVQAPFSGKLSFYTTPGVITQKCGAVTYYSKRNAYHFEYPARFNDGGHATIKGSVQWEMPTDPSNLSMLQMKFGSEKAIESQIVQTTVNKAIYMTGPLMSSKESYAEKKNYLINWIEDQIQNGVYKTYSRDQKILDPMTGKDKTVMMVDIVQDSLGVVQRQEESALKQFGIKTFNFSVQELVYDDAVEKQIRGQQQLIMDVQTSMAEAKKAEQRAFTVAKNGEADAKIEEWKQKAIMAKEVTLATQNLEVAKLDAQAAAQKKQKMILEGEGEAEKRKLIMNADGGLAIKKDAYVEVQRNWAENLCKYPGNWVPQIVMAGGEGKGGITAASGMMEMMNILSVKAAKDLGLDLQLSGVDKTKR
jgi:hypothetical protein